ncbi:MAG: hypothetical protein KGJ86_21440, partial [Chloroflexota bacterium]|nr:hypothetical protein [Chloroflexota bacterium]
MAAEQVRKGILVVHGIGRHAESSTLLEMGAPLLQWVLDWMRLRGRTAWLERGGLATAETDDLSSLPPAHVSLRVEPSVPDAGDGLHWIMAEAWWAASVQKPRLSDISSWTFCNFVRCGFDLNKHLTDRRVRLAHPRGTDPELWARAVDLANNVLTSALFWVGFVVAIPFVALALILTQVPVPAIQKFTVVHVLEAFLNSNMADMQALVQDEVQAASIRGRILRALEWLVRQGCSELYVIAHSGGVVAAFETLCQASNPEQERPEIVRRVKKFFSLGEGLNKAWLIDGQQPRWRIPLEPSIAWRDFWSAYDPVPVTPLRQELRTLQSQSSNPITSLQVTNRMDLATDHGAYWHNDEQVISRMAQEIDAAEPGESQFVLPRLAEHVRQRRRRVSVLVA